MAFSIYCSECGKNKLFALGKRGLSIRYHCRRDPSLPPCENDSRSQSRLRFLRTLSAIFVFLGIPTLMLLALVSSNFIKIGTYPPQAEAKSGLRHLSVAQLSHQQERGSFSDDLAEIDFHVERGNRYAYFGSSLGEVERRDQAELVSKRPLSTIQVDSFLRPKLKDSVPDRFADTGCPASREPGIHGLPIPLGVSGISSEERFLVYAAANLDQDPTLDCWSIASFDRVDPKGESIPAYEAHQDQSDIEF